MVEFDRAARELELEARTRDFVRDVVIPYEADPCVQILGGLGITTDTPVSAILREIRALRIYDGPSELHVWSIANRIKRGWQKTTLT